MSVRTTPDVTRHAAADPRATSDHSCVEVATIGNPTQSPVVGHVWRNAWRDSSELHVTHDSTIDGLIGLSSDGRDDPALLREAAAVLLATADELALAASVARHPAGSAR